MKKLCCWFVVSSPNKVADIVSLLISLLFLEDGTYDLLRIKSSRSLSNTLNNKRFEKHPKHKIILTVGRVNQRLSCQNHTIHDLD